MKIRELLRFCHQGHLFDIPPSATSRDVAETLKDRNVGALLVISDDREVLGIVSERDLARAFAEDGEAMTKKSVVDLMTRDIEVCAMDDDVVETMGRLNRLNIRHMPVVEDGRALAMLSIRDFEHACAVLQDQAKTDALTGLANRRVFEDSLDTEFRLHQRFTAPMSIAVFDIDHFKSVNDTYGHAVGDQILRAVALTLRNTVRSFDVVARIGGEEFSILFPHTPLSDAVTAAKRVVAEIEATKFDTDAGVVPITISGGLSMIQGRDGAGSDIMRRADSLLYKAKDDGRNRLVVDEERGSDALFTGAWPASVRVATR